MACNLIYPYHSYYRKLWVRSMDRKIPYHLVFDKLHLNQLYFLTFSWASSHGWWNSDDRDPFDCPLSPCLQRCLPSSWKGHLWWGYVKTRNQMRVAIQSGCVTNILALQRWSKNDFPPEFQNLKMHSFPIMYNTMGSKLDGLAVRDHFLPKNGLKTAILGVTILDSLTSEGAGAQSCLDV